MKKIGVVIVGVALMSLASPSAFAKARFAIVGAVNNFKPTNSGYAGTWGAKLGYGGGALVEFGMSPRMSFEVGALYLQRKTLFTFTDTTTDTVTMTQIEAPVQLRFWLNHMISLSAGGYYAMALGKAKSTLTGTSSYADQGLKTSDYGVLGGISFNFMLSGSTTLVIDGRYVLGLANYSTVTGGKFKNTEMQGLVGLKFGGNK